MAILFLAIQSCFNKVLAEYCCNVKANAGSCTEVSTDSSCKCGLYDTKEECNLLCGTCDGDGSCEADCGENSDTCKDCK